MYKMENVLYNVSVTYEAVGLMESGRRKREGRTEGKREQKRSSKNEEEMESQGVGDGGKEGGEGGEGGKVWKLADRTGYAQTGSQAQAQT